MASAQKDTSPNMGTSAGGKSGVGGKKNVDGREGGAGWNSANSPQGGMGGVASFSERSVGVEPNNGLKELPKKGVIGDVI